jgi:hypothetical protein
MPEDLDEIIVETVLHGSVQRVTAMDPASLVEVVFQAPRGADQSTIVQLARQKLAWRIAKEKQPSKPGDGRGGILA